MNDAGPRFQVGQRVRYRLGNGRECTGEIQETHLTAATRRRMYVVRSDAGMTHVLHEHELTDA